MAECWLLSCLVGGPLRNLFTTSNLFREIQVEKNECTILLVDRKMGHEIEFIQKQALIRKKVETSKKRGL